MEYLEPDYRHALLKGAYKLDQASMTRIVSSLEALIPEDDKRSTTVTVEKKDKSRIACKPNEIDLVNLHASELKSVTVECSCDRDSVSLSFDNVDKYCFVSVRLKNSKAALEGLASLSKPIKAWYSFYHENVGLVVRATIGVFISPSLFFLAGQYLVYGLTGAFYALGAWIAVATLILIFTFVAPGLFFDFGSIGLELRRQGTLRKAIIGGIAAASGIVLYCVTLMNSVTEFNSTLKSHSVTSSTETGQSK